MSCNSKRILVIPDTQVKPNIDMTYLAAFGEYIVQKKPDIIVHLGDHYDFPSLSSYDKGKKSFEGRRLKADIEAGNRGMDLLLSPLKELQERQRQSRKKVYNPELIFTLGNHDERVDRLAENTPELSGFIGTSVLHLERWGWKVVPFLETIERQGIHFTHYLSNPFTGKPYGGNAMNQLKTVGCSFVVGHRQTLDIAMRPTLDGKQQLGVIIGASYPHDEDYKGPQTGNNHFRGLLMLNEVRDGFGLVCPVSTEYLIKKYKEKA